MDQIWWNHIIKAHAFLENVVKEAAGVTSDSSTPNLSTMMALTLDVISAIILNN